MAKKLFTAFTRKYNGITSVLTSPVRISEIDFNQWQKSEAIWDTGAMGTLITESYAARAGLKSTGKRIITGVHDEQNVDKFLVDILLPNDVIVEKITVASCERLFGNAEMLIGMDIIALGDFSITNVNNETTFSFRIPSIKRIDYAAEAIRIRDGKTGANYTPPKKKRSKTKQRKRRRK